jgi:hypothetical protein
MGAWMRTAALFPTIGCAVLLRLIVLDTARAEDEVPPKEAFVAALQKAIGADEGMACGTFPFSRPLLWRQDPSHPEPGVVPQALRNGHWAETEGGRTRARARAGVRELARADGEGSRNIWVGSFSPDLEPKFEIITINDGGP